MCRQDEAGFPQKQLETAFLHSLRLLEQNREYLQMHLQPLKDARTAQALEDMEQEAARLERTFRELMELSAPEEPVQKRPVDLCRLLAQLEGLRGEIDAQSSTKLTVDCGGLEQCFVWGDREMAEQICFHLLSNALRAAAPGGNIQVCLRQTGQDIRLTIEDDGCGMDEAMLARVSSPFTTTRKTRKVGLGVPMARQICEMCEGSFAIESKVGVGTVFTVKLAFELAKEEALLPVLSDEALDFANRDAVFDACKAKAEELGKKNGWLLYPLGIALSGKQRTPGGGTDLACMMGREKTLQRVQDAIAKLNG